MLGGSVTTPSSVLMGWASLVLRTLTFQPGVDWYEAKAKPSGNLTSTLVVAALSVSLGTRTLSTVNAPAGALKNDLAIDASGYGLPDPVAAGYAPVAPDLPTAWPVVWIATLSLVVLALVAALGRRGIARQGI
jgi:hypothetical protein